MYIKDCRMTPLQNSIITPGRGERGISTAIWNQYFKLRKHYKQKSNKM